MRFFLVYFYTYMICSPPAFFQAFGVWVCLLACLIFRDYLAHAASLRAKQMERAVINHVGVLFHSLIQQHEECPRSVPKKQGLLTSPLDICSNLNGRVCFPLKSDNLANFPLKSQQLDCERMMNTWNNLLRGGREKRECGSVGDHIKTAIQRQT